MANRFLNLQRDTKPLDLSGFRERQRERQTQRDRDFRRDQAESRARQLREEATRLLKPAEIAKETARGVFSIGKELAKIAAAETAGVALTAVELPKILITGKAFEPIQVPGLGEVKTVSRRAQEATERFVGGEITGGQAAGEFGEIALDVVTTFAAPLKGLKIARKGKFVKGVVEGSTTGAQYGFLYGLTTAAKERESLVKGAITGAGTGFAAGTILGAGTGIIGKVIKRKVQLNKDPEELVKVIGKDKNVIDYIATRPNLRIVENKKIGKNKAGEDAMSRFEWDYRGNRGVLTISPDASNEVLTHSIGQYIERMNPDIGFQFEDEVAAIAGKGRSVDEGFSFAVSKLLTDPLVRLDAPELTKFLESKKLILPELSDDLAKQGLTMKEIGALPDLDRKDFIENIKPKLEKLRPLKNGEVLAIQTGKSPFVDTDIKVALNRGTNANTKVTIVKKADLKLPEPARAARGERLIDGDEVLAKEVKDARLVKKKPVEELIEEVTKVEPQLKEVPSEQKVISKARTKFNEAVNEQFRIDPEINRLGLQQQGEEAIKILNKDKDKALRIALGLEEAPAGTTKSVMSQMLESIAETNPELLPKGITRERLLLGRKLRATRNARELQAETGIDKNDSGSFVSEALKGRLAKFSKIKNKDFKGRKFDDTRLQIASEKSKLKKELKSKRLDIKEAQTIIDKITCNA